MTFYNLVSVRVIEEQSWAEWILVLVRAYVPDRGLKKSRFSPALLSERRGSAT